MEIYEHIDCMTVIAFKLKKKVFQTQQDLLFVFILSLYVAADDQVARLPREPNATVARCHTDVTLAVSERHPRGDVMAA